MIHVALLLLLGHSLAIGFTELFGVLISKVVVPCYLVQVLQLAQFLEDRPTDGALAGGEGDVCEGRPVVFSKFGGFCLFTIEWELLKIVETLQHQVSTSMQLIRDFI
jgi:hypothetical protein